MAAPNITGLTVAQGTGDWLTESIVEIEVTFTADGACDLTVELSVDNGSNWYDAILHSEYDGIAVAQGSDRQVAIDVNLTFAQAGFPARGDYSNCCKVRVTATDASEQTGTSTSNAFSLKSLLPVLSSATMSAYIGNALASAAPISLSGHDGASPPGTPTWFRANLSVSQLDTASSATFHAYGSGSVTFAFPAGTADGQQTLYLKIYDEFYNGSATGSVTTWLQKQAPQNCAVGIVGSTGSGDYTGIAIAGDGSFSPDRSVTLQLSADSDIPLRYRIEATSDVEQRANINVIYNLNSDTNTPTVYLTTNPSSPESDDYNCDATVTVSVTFLDAASNQTVGAGEIRLNTRIYQATYSPLRVESATYQPLLREVTAGGAEVTIPRTQTITDDPIRLWDDIFYPTSHSYPTDANGDLDEDAAIAMNNVSDSDHDAVLVAGGQVTLDDEGRAITTDWTEDGTKDYGHMLSSSAASLVYWVIDTTGYGNYRLEFESCDLNSDAYGPPYNTAAPYTGDVLAVYNADAAGALTQTIDDQGETSWELSDSTLLSELYAFTGQGTNVMDLTSGARMNSNAQGGFNTDWIRGVNKVVLVLYTDAAGTGSGFKLKSSPAYDRTWINYHIDATHGELWIHKHSSLGTAAGAADATTKRMIYDWLTQPVTIDYDAGTVTFSSPPSGASPVITADYSYHQWEDGSPPSGTLWLAGQDDFLDYADAYVYVQNLAGSSLTPTDAEKLEIYETSGYGRMSTGYTWDKDKGLLELDADAVPPSGQRLFADYQHHTYKRLSNDGYGDLAWRDAIVVADDTPQFPDYTYTDVKIVNEGDAALEDAKVDFVARGYDTNNDGEVVLTGGDVVDQVLDLNRPWDIQRGTAAETYNKMAMHIQENFLWTRSMSKTDARTVLSTWADATYGDIAARSRVFGRAVWVLGGTSGSSYPSTSAGEKRCSVEITGKYYAQLIT